MKPGKLYIISSPPNAGKSRLIRRGMTYVVIVTTPSYDIDIVSVFGPFETEADALAWEDRKLDAPPGSRAVITPILDPSLYPGIPQDAGDNSDTIERMRQHRRNNPPPTN